MTNHLNAFEPYVSKPAHHEDALTRGFLLVLRGVPVAHAAWLELVHRAHRAAGGDGVPPFHELGTPSVQMQTAHLDDEVDRVVSVVQTDEVYFKDGDVVASKRRQVLDGVVAYAQGLAIVVENKPRREDIWDGQLDINLPPDVTLDRKAACVTWKDIVSAWGGLLEAGHLGSAESVLLGDFLAYVEDHFPLLSPYSTVGQCGENVERLKRRCRTLLQEIAGEDRVAYHRGWSWFIRLEGNQSAKQIGMIPMRGSEGISLSIEFCPGDTMLQARRLYTTCDLGEILALEGQGWTIRPNQHVSHMTLNLLWTHTTVSTKDYWRFWAANQDLLEQVPRARFEEMFARFVKEGLATEADRAAYDAKVIATKRQSYNLCPGLVMRWAKSLDDAAVLDRRGQLVSELRSAIECAARALKLALPWNSQQPTARAGAS